jgi:CRP-like cAMP-binding protein
MATVEQLQQILLLRGLPQDFLEELAPLAEPLSFQEGETIQQVGQEADTFYMLLRGKVLFNVEASPEVTVSLGSVRGGYSFGWPALLPERDYLVESVALEPSEVLAVPAHGLRELMDRRQAVGYELMKRVYAIMLNRLRRRTGQFVRSIGRELEVEEIPELDPA